MRVNQQINLSKTCHSLFMTSLVFGVVACSSDSDSGSGTGFVKFYHASENAPAIHLTIDEDLETSEDDEIEVTFSGVSYGQALSNSEFDSQDYYFELAWQDEDSSERSELELIYQDSLTVKDDTISFIVLNEDIQQAKVTVYDIPVIDDDDDDTYDRFNYRLLNLHQEDSGVDVYVSQSDETFNEAVMVGSYAYQSLSENQKLDQGSYIFYLTKPGQTEVLYQSSVIDYYYSAQYVMVIRKNSGAGSSSYVIDRVSNSSTVEYIDLNAEAQFRAYNGIDHHSLLPEYQGNVSVQVQQLEQAEQISELSYGQLSEAITVENGDYSINLVTSEQQSPLLSNHLLSLPENANKTIFFYSDEVNVDDDNDGDVDEDGDGIVDQKELNIHSLVVDNSVRDSIYDHQVKMVNLVDSEDFNSVTVYFVRADETIETANYKRTLGFAAHDAVNLKNNTYQVYVVARENSSDIILSNFELILDETSVDQFLVVELDEQSPTGYKTSLLNQREQ